MSGKPRKAHPPKLAGTLNGNLAPESEWHEVHRDCSRDGGGQGGDRTPDQQCVRLPLYH